MKRLLNGAVVLGAVWSAFQLYTAWAGAFPAMVQRPLHVAFALGLTFLLLPRSGKKSAEQSDPELGELARTQPGLFDWALSLLSLSLGLYVVLNYDRLTSRVAFVDSVLPGDVVVGLLFVVLLLEACRRTVGWSLTLVAIVFLAYLIAGPWLPGAIGHRGISFAHFVELQALSPQGIFGVPTGVSTDYIFYFILLAAFLQVSGGGQLFIDLAIRLTGRARGGPAKAAVVGSAFMGSISGSAVANVVSTGIFTIPLMKRIGYSAVFSGALEAVASTGGQLMPPIMGAAAFIMAEMIGTAYSQIILAALVPAVAYYVALYFMVDFQARRQGLHGLSVAELPSLQEIRRRLHLLLPLAVLLYFVFAGSSLQLSAFRAILAVVVVSWLHPSTRLSLMQLYTALALGAQQAMRVTIPAATAGIIVGVVSYTGIGLQFSSWIVQLAGGRLLIALLLVMLGSIILGMGMPTSGAYIMAAVLMAPALVRLGVPTLAAHMFVFYFACLSMITPPVALASYAAAGISRAGLMETGWQAVQLGLAAFIVPYAFAFHPDLLTLHTGFAPGALQATVSLLLGVVALAGAIIHYMLTPTTRVETVLLWAAALLLVAPEPITDLFGIVAFAWVLIQQWRRRSPAIAGA